MKSKPSNHWRQGRNWKAERILVQNLVQVRAESEQPPEFCGIRPKVRSVRLRGLFAEGVRENEIV